MVPDSCSESGSGEADPSDILNPPWLRRQDYPRLRRRTRRTNCRTNKRTLILQFSVNEALDGCTRHTGIAARSNQSTPPRTGMPPTLQRITRAKITPCDRLSFQLHHPFEPETLSPARLCPPSRAVHPKASTPVQRAAANERQTAGTMGRSDAMGWDDAAVMFRSGAPEGCALVDPTECSLVLCDARFHSSHSAVRAGGTQRFASCQPTAEAPEVAAPRDAQGGGAQITRCTIAVSCCRCHTGN